MEKLLNLLGDKAMETAGNKAKRGIENFMKAFKDYDIETIVANLEVVGEKIPQIKATLQITMRKRQA